MSCLHALNSCTCTVMCVSGESRFADAFIWSIGVMTKSTGLTTVVSILNALVNIWKIIDRSTWRITKRDDFGMIHLSSSEMQGIDLTRLWGIEMEIIYKYYPTFAVKSFSGVARLARTVVLSPGIVAHLLNFAAVCFCCALINIGKNGHT